MMALKASDIANPSKRWNVYKPWIDRLFRGTLFPRTFVVVAFVHCGAAPSAHVK